MNKFALAGACLVLSAVSAQAQYVDGLPAATSVSSSDLMPVIQGSKPVVGAGFLPGSGVARRATVGQVLAIPNNTAAITGGTISGADVSGANVTATGGTVARTAAKHFGDVANALDFGADPTGMADSSVAINAALAATVSGVRRNVYLPAGTYRLTQAITVGSATQGQCLEGDGYSTVLTAGADFDPAANGVVVITGPASPNDVQPCVRDLAIRLTQPTDIITSSSGASAAGATTVTLASVTGIAVGDYVVDVTNAAAIPRAFPVTTTPGAVVSSISGNVVTLSQAVKSPGISSGDTIDVAHPRAAMLTLAQSCTTGVGGTGCRYPWAIYGFGMGIPKIDHVLIGGAWNGIYLHGGNSGGTNSFTLTNAQVSALNVGLDIDNIHNFPQIDNYEFWNGWGLGTEGSDQRAAFSSIFYDDSTICANIGATDGVVIGNFQCWTGKLNLTSTWSWGSFANLEMDGTYANLNVSGGQWVQIANFYSTHGQSLTALNAVAISSGDVTVSSAQIVDASRHSTLEVTGGILRILGGKLVAGNGGNAAFADVSSGTLQIDNTEFNASGGCTGNLNTLVRQSATGILKLSNDYTTGACAGLPGVSIATDVAGNSITGLNFPGWRFPGPTSLPSGPLGIYGPNPSTRVRSITGTASDTETAFDSVIVWNSATATAKAESIFGCSGNNAGQAITIVDGFGSAAADAITVTPQGGTINGATSASISASHGSMRLTCDGVSNWLAD